MNRKKQKPSFAPGFTERLIEDVEEDLFGRKRIPVPRSVKVTADCPFCGETVYVEVFDLGQVRGKCGHTFWIVD